MLGRFSLSSGEGEVPQTMHRFDGRWRLRLSGRGGCDMCLGAIGGWRIAGLVGRGRP